MGVAAAHRAAVSEMQRQVEEEARAAAPGGGTFESFWGGQTIGTVRSPVDPAAGGAPPYGGGPYGIGGGAPAPFGVEGGTGSPQLDGEDGADTAPGVTGWLGRRRKARKDRKDRLKSGSGNGDGGAVPPEGAGEAVEGAGTLAGDGAAGARAGEGAGGVLGKIAGFIDRASWHRLRLTLLGSILLAAVATLLSIPGTDLPFEGNLYDFRLKTRIRLQEPGTAEGIVIIGIDDASRTHPQGSMAEVFSPGVYSEILDALVEAGVASVAIHRNMPTSETRMYSARDELSWWASFGSARAKNVPVVYGFRYLSGSPILPSARYVEIMGRDTLAFMNLPLDRDLKVRDADVRWRAAGGPRPGSWSDGNVSFAYLAARTVMPDLPEPPDGRFHIDFRDSIMSFSFADIYQRALNGQLDFFKQNFRGALVLIGDTSSLNLDTHPVPLSTFSAYAGWDLMPAVVIQAHAANTLLRGRTMVMPDTSTLFGFFFGIMFITLVPVMVSRPQSPRRLAWLPTAVLMAYALATVVAFNRYVLLPCVPGVAAILMAHALYWGMRITEKRREADTRTRALNLYLDPALAGRIIADPSILSRRGERRQCTVFFSDFEGFTAASETMSTEDMVDLVNLYYDTMTRAIERFGGFVDKFVGDAIMAVWGAPSSQPQHAASACFSALAQQQALRDLTRERQAQGLPTLRALMGINTGSVIAGNVGAQKHMAYTVMGDSVNLASRLVSVNKLFKTLVIASEATAREAGDQVVFRPLDRVRVLGRKKSINIYEVMARAGELPEGGHEMIGFFERALRHYWARDFPAALARFERAHRSLPDDLPSQIFIDRCRGYIRHEPDENWDGVTVLGLK
jgi:class 3 adenylate cyclase/CHASE2 domain-containing sensor protein